MRRGIVWGALGVVLLGCGLVWHWTTVVMSAGDPRAVVQIVDRRGDLLAERLPERFGRREVRALSQFAPTLIAQVLAQEDRHFWWHPGIDPVAIARAAWRNVQAGRRVQGGSTISQQLAKMYLENWRGQPVARTVRWKIAEALLALRLEWRYTKSEILENYLNNIYLGAHCYGAEAAALAYFGKSAQDLLPPEAAQLVAHIRRPNLPQSLQVSFLAERPLAPHLLQMVTAGCAVPAGRQGVPGAGCRIATTLDARVQRAAVDAVRRGVAGLRDSAPQVQAAAVVIDPRTSELVALVGSSDRDDHAHAGAVNYALALRQSGSALKPFTYYLAFLHGRSPALLVPDEPYQFLLANGRSYQPHNFDRQFRGPISLREALGNSLNVPAVLLLSELGVAGLLETLRDYGVTSLTDSPAHYGLSLTLGSGAVSLLELTNAYAALARGGEFLPLRIVRSSATFAAPLSPLRSRRENSAPQRAARLVTKILADPDARLREFGEATLMQLPDQPVAIKTGTSNGARDAWAIGYSPRFAVGVWVGNPDNTPMPGLTGAKAAVPIWHQIMRGLHDGLPVENFPAVRPFHQVASAARPRGSIAASLRLIAPAHGAVYQLDPARPLALQQIRAEVRLPGTPSPAASRRPLPDGERNGEGNGALINWRLDQQLVAQTATTTPHMFLPLTIGVHRLTAQVGAQRTSPVEFTVIAADPATEPIESPRLSGESL